jgi:hypothetical protein
LVANTKSSLDIMKAKLDAMTGTEIDYAAVEAEVRRLRGEYERTKEALLATLGGNGPPFSGIISRYTCREEE